MENLQSIATTYNNYRPVYSQLQESLIKKEFSRVEDQCYLEHAGATLYSEVQISRVMQDLTGNTYGNPHARNISSKLTEDAIDQIRYEILHHFNTTPEEYSVIFTSGATAALKLVAENFIYENELDEHGAFVYLQDNHTSVLGMREYAKHSECMSQQEALKLFSNNKTQIGQNTNSLFAYPAQCNFSGTKYPLSWIKQVKQGTLNQFNKINGSKNWYIMLDSASFVSTNILDLAQHKPDFLCLSFYKIFGYPTGLGALIVRNESAHVLGKKYFGGGTVLMSLSSERTHILRTVLHERFEDGTLPFLSIISLKHGFDTLKRISLDMNDVSRHTFALAQYVYHSLLFLHHGNGAPVAVVYHDTNFKDVKHQGGIVNFNLLRPSGEHIGFAEVLHIANLYGIHLRTGCFCNPGACQRHLNLTPDDVRHHFESGHVCGDQNDLIDGYPTGSVRISFGYMSSKRHCDEFLNMIEECFVTKPIVRKAPSAVKVPHEMLINGNAAKIINLINKERSKCDGTLKHIMIYPIKSCAAYEVNDWELTDTGFKFDRQWMIVNSSGICLTQKQNTNLCLVKPKIDLQKSILELTFTGKGSAPISIPLILDKTNPTVWSEKCQSKVCGDRVQGWDCGNEIANWLSSVLNLPNLRLLRQCDNSEGNRPSKYEKDQHLSLANEAQFLLINTASVQWLSDCIPKDDFEQDLEGMIQRFRPNLVMEFEKAFAENSFSNIQIGDLTFKCERLCTRCQMICINQSNGKKSVEPLKTLSKEFNGKISFGVYLSHVGKCLNEKVSTAHKIVGSL